MIMDTFAALALATEPPTDDVLLTKPTKKTEKIINETMWRSVMFQVVCQLIASAVLLLAIPKVLGVPSSVGVKLNWTNENGMHFTFFFHCFVFMQMFNFVNARVLERSQLNPFTNACNNPIFWVILLMTFIG
jgi:Ca2+ transporting ATPase